LITINLNKLNAAEFVARYGGLYEHSPWIAELAWQSLDNEQSISLEALRERLKTIVDDSSKEQQLALLKAHPELAGKAAIDGKLTAESTDEQASARLDLCSQEEFDRFQQLNTQYNEKFGFPFIVAVRGKNRAEILAAFEQRLGSSKTNEFELALQQVHQIASLRLNALEEANAQ